MKMPEELKRQVSQGRACPVDGGGDYRHPEHTT